MARKYYELKPTKGHPYYFATRNAAKGFKIAHDIRGTIKTKKAGGRK